MPWLDFEHRNILVEVVFANDAHLTEWRKIEDKTKALIDRFAGKAE
jgi:hypothetical protein